MTVVPTEDLVIVIMGLAVLSGCSGKPCSTPAEWEYQAEYKACYEDSQHCKLSASELQQYQRCVDQEKQK